MARRVSALLVAVRRLRGDVFSASVVGFGSGPANQSAELVARIPPVELGCHKVDVRLDRVPTPSRRWPQEIEVLLHSGKLCR